MPFRRKAGQRSKPTEYNGILFDSASEAEVYKELMLMQQGGYISNLQRQVQFELYPKLKNLRTVDPIKGWSPGSASSYKCDFFYLDHSTNRMTINECKGHMSPQNKINYRVFLQRYLPEYDMVITTCTWRKRGGVDILDSIEWHYYLYDENSTKPKLRKKTK